MPGNKARTPGRQGTGVVGAGLGKGSGNSGRLCARAGCGANVADPKAAAALRFAAELVKKRGHVSEAEVEAVRAAGYDDAQLVEIVLHVALNTLTNYVNSALGTDLDFPKVSPRVA